MRKNLRTAGSYFLAAAVISPLLVFSAAAQQQSNVTQLLQRTKTTAAQLARDVEHMEMFTRSKTNWQSHASQISVIKEHINNAGKLVSQLEDARDGAAQWQHDAIDHITPLLKEMASNTESIIDHLNKAKQVWSPQYQEYLKENHDLAEELYSAISDFVQYGTTRQKIEMLEKKLETS